jgi:hypothetical protein
MSRHLMFLLLMVIAVGCAVPLGHSEVVGVSVTSTIKWQILRHILAVPSTFFLALSHSTWRRFHP